MQWARIVRAFVILIFCFFWPQATVSVAAQLVKLTAFPADLQLYPRDPASNRASVIVAGTVISPTVTRVVLTVADADGSARTFKQAPDAATTGGTFRFEVEVAATLDDHSFVLSVDGGAGRREVARADRVVAGDVFVVSGQSNAVAQIIKGSTAGMGNPFVRSFGSRTESGKTTLDDTGWHVAEGDAKEGPGAVGQWPLLMASELVRRHGVPIAVLNGGQNAYPIIHLQRDDANPENLDTTYGRLLWRVRRAGVEDAVRAVLWYQGESDADVNAPDAYAAMWDAIRSDWRVDFNRPDRIIVMQIRQGCGKDRDNVNRIQERQRRFADIYPEVRVMSTAWLDGQADLCHFGLADGQDRLSMALADLLSVELFGGRADAPVLPPNPARAWLSAGDRSTVTVRMRDAAEGLRVDPGVHANFGFDIPGAAVSADAEGDKLQIGLPAGLTPGKLFYFGHEGGGPWITGERSGLGMLTFRGLPIEPAE